jgi:hypothetical protein
VVLVAAHALDQGSVADANAEQEPLRIRLGEGELTGHHGQGISDPDVRDPRGNGHPRGRGQQQPCITERFAAPGFPHPEGPVAKLFELRDSLPYQACRLIVELPGPDPDASDVHGDGPPTAQALGMSYVSS